MKTFLKGMATGLAVGATTAAVLMPKSKKSKKVMKTGTGRALKAAGTLIDNLQSMVD